MNAQHRKLLFVWIAALVLACCGTLGYGWKKTPDGLIYLTEGQVLDLLKPIAVLYGCYLGAIVLAAFVGPTQRRNRDLPAERRLAPDRVRLAGVEADSAMLFGPAMACTILFNLVILFFVFRGYAVDAPRIDEDFGDLAVVAKWFSFLVAPINLFYFGIPVPQGRAG